MHDHACQPSVSNHGSFGVFIAVPTGMRPEGGRSSDVCSVRRGGAAPLRLTRTVSGLIPRKASPRSHFRA